VVPAVRWKYDNLLNTLDVRSLVVAMLTLMGAFAIRLERRDDPLAVYGMSAETATSTVIILMNVALFAVALYEFRAELLATITSATSAWQGPLSAVSEAVVKPIVTGFILCFAGCATLTCGKRSTVRTYSQAGPGAVQGKGGPTLDLTRMNSA